MTIGTRSYHDARRGRKRMIGARMIGRSRRNNFGGCVLGCMDEHSNNMRNRSQLGVVFLSLSPQKYDTNENQFAKKSLNLMHFLRSGELSAPIRERPERNSFSFTVSILIHGVNTGTLNPIFELCRLVAKIKQTLGQIEYKKCLKTFKDTSYLMEGEQEDVN